MDDKQRRCAMPQTATCSCGYVMSFSDEEEFYGLVRRHIVPVERERHRLVARSLPLRKRAADVAERRRVGRPVTARFLRER
jgi:hypothetical protein